MDSDGLIPGLSDDLAVQCMLRVPRVYHFRMRGVSSRWRRVVRNKAFYEQRRRLRIVDTSIFFLPQYTTPSRLDCVEFDLASGKKSTGANLQFPRGDMAWGLLGGRLVVAGGWAGQDTGPRVETEIYNIETNGWSQLANLPHDSFTVDTHFVLSGRLYARGYNQKRRLLKMVSYDLESNTWREEADMLKHFEQVSPPLSLNRVAIKVRQLLVLLEVEDSDMSAQAETDPVVLNIKKLNLKTGKWKKLCRVLDEVMHYDCQCTFERDVRFLGMKEKVIFLTHSEEEEDIEVEKVPGQHEVLRLSMLCPSNWSTTLVEA